MIYRLKELQGDTIAVPQLVFSKLGIAEEYNVRVALYVLATGITDPDNKSLFNTRVIFWINAQCCNSRFFYLYRIQRCIRIDLIRWKEYRLIGGFNDHIAIIFIAFDPAYIAFDRRRNWVILWKIIAILSISERLIYPAQ